MYYVVKYTGPFGFIKPWTAVRDGETFSQQFLVASTLEGIEKKLFPELLRENGTVRKICRYRLNYCGLDSQLERTWSKGGFVKERKTDSQGRVYYLPKNISIITRGVLLYPHLYLAFANEGDALRASRQSVCLCRNEDILLPERPVEMPEEAFEQIEGFEWIATDEGNGFKSGYNRYGNSEAMYGKLYVTGNPIRNHLI